MVVTIVRWHYIPTYNWGDCMIFLCFPGREDILSRLYWNLHPHVKGCSNLLQVHDSHEASKLLFFLVLPLCLLCTFFVIPWPPNIFHSRITMGLFHMRRMGFTPDFFPFFRPWGWPNGATTYQYHIISFSIDPKDCPIFQLFSMIHPWYPMIRVAFRAQMNGKWFDDVNPAVFLGLCRRWKRFRSAWSRRLKKLSRRSCLEAADLSFFGIFDGD